MSTAPRHRTLVAIPAYNEAATIRNVVERVRQNLPRLRSGCRQRRIDATRRPQSSTAPGRPSSRTSAISDTVEPFRPRCCMRNARVTTGSVTLDADGQHDPGAGARIADRIRQRPVGSADRFALCRQPIRYTGVPFGRRLGMQLFSTHRRPGGRAARLRYDVGAEGHRPADVQVADATGSSSTFHAEALGLSDAAGISRIGECPITVEERRHGSTMYSAFSHIKYPLKTALMVCTRRRRSQPDEKTDDVTTGRHRRGIAIGLALLVWVVNLIRSGSSVRRLRRHFHVRHDCRPSSFSRCRRCCARRRASASSSCRYHR